MQGSPAVLLTRFDYHGDVGVYRRLTAQNTTLPLHSLINLRKKEKQIYKVGQEEPASPASHLRAASQRGRGGQTKLVRS